MNKDQMLKFRSLVLKSSICCHHIQEEVKSVFSVVLVSEKLSSFKAQGGYSVFAGVGERTREGNDLYHEMIESAILGMD